HKAIEEEIAGNAKGDEPAVLVLATQADQQSSPGDQNEKCDHSDRADQTELLADHREYKVGLLFRQKVEVALRALQETFAPRPTRAQSDLGLDDVVSGTERVALGVQERVDPRALVIVQMLIGITSDEWDGQQHENEFPPSDSGGEEDHASQHQGDHRGAKIGLLQDQSDRDQNRDQWWKQKQRVADPFPTRAVEPCRQRENQSQLHQFRRLDLLTTQVQPALSTFADVADFEHENQQCDTAGIGDPSKSGADAAVDQ